MTEQLLLSISVASQAAFMLALGLLAWNDRRSRGSLWLATSFGLLILLTLSVPHSVAPPVPPLGPFALIVMIALSYTTYRGVHWFVRRTEVPWWHGLPIVLPALGTVLALEGLSARASMAAGRCVAIVITVWIAHLLLRNKIPAMRRAARFCAAVTVAMAVCILLRMMNAVHLITLGETGMRVLMLAMVVTITLLALSFLGLHTAEAKRRLYQESRVDALTGLHNRRSMEEIAQQEIASARWSHRPLSLLMVDADNFKRLNDTWGHSAGDRTLRCLGEVLLQTAGPGCPVARFGGEEFVVLLPASDAGVAVRMAERIRQRVERIRIQGAEGEITCTVSIGIGVLLGEDCNWSPLLRRADIALYRAKREGRNRAVLQEEETGSAVRDVPRAAVPVSKTPRYGFGQGPAKDAVRASEPALGLLSRQAEFAHDDRGLHVISSSFE